MADGDARALLGLVGQPRLEAQPQAQAQAQAVGEIVAFVETGERTAPAWEAALGSARGRTARC